MSKRNKIIASITGIVLVLLILIGLTYAYFLTRIQGNTNTKSISATTANLRLVYGDGNANIITKEKILPGTVIGEKDFTVTNEGDSETDYIVVIDDVNITNVTDGTTTTFNSNDFVYTLSCIQKNKNTNEVSGTCDSVSTEESLPLTNNGLLISNKIGENIRQEYVLTVTYKETGIDQSNDMNKKLEAKVDIKDIKSINPYSSNTNLLAYNIINNSIQNKNGTELRNVPLTKVAKERSAPQPTGKYKNIKISEIKDFNLEPILYIDDTKEADNPTEIKYNSCKNSDIGKYIFKEDFGYQLIGQIASCSDGEYVINNKKISEIRDIYLGPIIYIGDTKEENNLTKTQYNSCKNSDIGKYIFEEGFGYYLIGQIASCSDGEYVISNMKVSEDSNYSSNTSLYLDDTKEADNPTEVQYNSCTNSDIGKYIFKMGWGYELIGQVASCSDGEYVIKKGKISDIIDIHYEPRLYIDDTKEADNPTETQYNSCKNSDIGKYIFEEGFGYQLIGQVASCSDGEYVVKKGKVSEIEDIHYEPRLYIDDTKKADNPTETQYNSCKNSDIGKYIFEEGSSYKLIGQVGTCINGEYAISYEIFNKNSLSVAMDDYGVSYYYRGDVEDNYVNFAGKCWRIVRIDGNGNVRIILEDKNTTCENANYTGDWSIGTGNYGYEQKAFNGNTRYIASYLNPVTKSNNAMKTKLDSWYTANLSSYSTKLNNETWCLGNETDMYYGIVEEWGAKPIYTKLTQRREELYASDTDFDYETSKKLFGDEKATLKCNGTTFNSYIGGITVDEATYAGGRISYSNENNTNYYLANKWQNDKPRNDSVYFWTISLINYTAWAEGDSSACVGSGGFVDTYSVHEDRSFRPVVSLIAGTKISSGDGTQSKPYVIS